MIQFGRMAHKYNFYFAMIFEKEELDHTGRRRMFQTYNFVQIT